MASKSGAYLSAAERLALLMKRYSISYDKVATQLSWSVEKLRAYLAPNARRIKATSDIDDTVVDKLLMKYRVVLAHQTVKNATIKSLKPVASGARRSSVPAQFGRNSVDRRSIIRADITPAQLKLSTDMEPNVTTSRKRKRRAIVMPLNTLNGTMTTDMSKDKTSHSKADTGSLLRTARKSELLCPIRLDVDLDGIRFQDTLLVNAALTTCSPEVLAAQIAQDENMSDKLKDAIAESIRRQMILFTSSVSFNSFSGQKLFPIYLDLIIDGFSLRDQFEWDLANDFVAIQTFASTLCADLNLPTPFQAAIVFSIVEQVVAYRIALSGHKWIGTNPFQVNGTGVTLPTSTTGYIETMPPLDEIVRDQDDSTFWQPVLSELSQEEVAYFSGKVKAARAPMTWKNTPKVVQPHGRVHRATRSLSKETRLPRPINPFIVFCQLQKETLGKTRRSASEMRKIMGDMWRKCTDEEKEYYAQVTEVENEKRRRDYVLDVRDRAIADWEEEEARRKGLLASTTLEASAEHFRGLLLENYMSERHQVDMKRQRVAMELPAEQDEDDENEDEMT